MLFEKENYKLIFMSYYYKIDRSPELYVNREKDVINIYGLDRAQAVSQFIIAINNGIKAGLIIS